MRAGLATVVLAALIGCDGATPEPGYGAALQLADAQFREGPFPAASGGPPTQQLVASHAASDIGTIRERLHAVLDPDARAAIAGIAGHDGAWIIVAGPPDVDTPGQPTATARFGLDPGVEAGHRGRSGRVSDVRDPRSRCQRELPRRQPADGIIGVVGWPSEFFRAFQ